MSDQGACGRRRHNEALCKLRRDRECRKRRQSEFQWQVMAADPNGYMVGVWSTSGEYRMAGFIHTSKACCGYAAIRQHILSQTAYLEPNSIDQGEHPHAQE